MGPQAEGGPSDDGRGNGRDDGRNYGGQPYTEDTRRYQSDRDLPRPNGAFSSENRIASPAGSAGGRDRETDPTKTSGERNGSRTRSARTASGQLRLCKKCNEPLTGQFVRALGGTFHLDCFRCRVRSSGFTF